MYYASAVHVLKGKTDLNEPVENLKFCELFILADLSLDVVSQVAN